MLTKYPRGIYFVDGKAVCVSPELAPEGAALVVMEIPSDHYDFFGPLKIKGLTCGEIQEEANRLMVGPKYHPKYHRYCVTLCPNCHNKLTQPDGVVIEFIANESARSRVHSQLNEDGLLKDVGGIVAQGWHCDTLCAECEESISIEEIF